MNTGIKTLTSIVTLDYKQPTEREQLWPWYLQNIQLDIQSLCRASMTCMSWFATIRNNDRLWKPHCLAVRAVCEREVDDDRKSGYSWRPCQSASLVSNKLNSSGSNLLPSVMLLLYLFQDILLRNYQKSQVKLGWLSGRYSNICSPISLPETIMCPMDAETWGEILEAELKRPNHKQIS